MGEDAAVLAKLEAISQRQEEIKETISGRLDETNEHLKSLNGKVAEHERWIREREFIISNTNARISILERASAEHQSYIDQRQQDLKDFAAMKVEIKSHSTYIDSQKGGSTAVAKLVMQALTLLGVILTWWGSNHPK